MDISGEQNKLGIFAVQDVKDILGGIGDEEVVCVFINWVVFS